MKPSKIQAIDEAGRTMALKRYAKPTPMTKYGHSQMGHNMRGKFQMQEGGFVGPVRFEDQKSLGLIPPESTPYRQGDPRRPLSSAQIATQARLRALGESK